MTFLMTPKKKSSKEQVKSEQFLSNQSSATVWRHFAVTGLRFDWCTPGDHGHLFLSLRFVGLALLDHGTGLVYLAASRFGAGVSSFVTTTEMPAHNKICISKSGHCRFAL